MAKKRETKDTGPFLTSLKNYGWFRKINDTVQVGIPDILGCRNGKFVGIEVKSIAEVPEDGLVPPKSSHTFSSRQVSDLKSIRSEEGDAYGVVICGKVAVFVLPVEISEEGQVNWYSIPEERIVAKEGGLWKLGKIFK